MTRVLIVEDEMSLAEAIKYSLEREGFETTVLTDGTRAVEHVRSWRPDVVLLDVMLPGLSGMDVCRSIRRIGNTPVIMVTAKDSESDKVLGLELGADDYVTKPFSTPELIARVRAVLRRTGAEPVTEEPSTVVEVSGIRLDADRYRVEVRGKAIDMPPKEFALLEALMRRAGRLATRDQLISMVWGDDYYGDTRTLDVHIKRLRSKIEDDPRNPELIKTVRGLGYKFEA